MQSKGVWGTRRNSSAGADARGVRRWRGDDVDDEEEVDVATWNLCGSHDGLVDASVNFFIAGTSHLGPQPLNEIESGFVLPNPLHVAIKIDCVSRLVKRLCSCLVVRNIS